MLIRRSEVWTRQPQVPCGINQSIPGLIVAGVPLLFCSRPISNIDSQNIAKVITKSGLGAQYSAYGASEVYLGKSLSEYTIVAIADIAHTIIERHLVDFDWYSNAWRGFQLRAVNNTIEFVPFDNVGNPAFCNVSTDAQASVIRPVVVVARQKAGIAKLDTSLGSASTSALATCRGLTSSLPVVVGQYANASDRNFSSDPISGYAVIDGFMSDADVARIIDNPWQIFAPERRTLFVPSGAGGTSSITSDASASYLIRNAISQDLASAFGIRGAVQADRASSYALRGAAQSNLSGAYSLRGSAFKDATAAYSIRGMVQSDEVASYNLRGSVQSSESASYAIRGAVSSDRSATYDILSASAVSSSLDASFAVRGAVPSDQAASFVVRGAAQSNQVVSYSIRGLVQSSLSAGYSIDAGVSAVSSDLLVSYFVGGAAAQCPTAEQNAAAVVAALPSASDIAAALIAALNATTIPVNIKQVNSVHIKGSGVVGDTWGPV